MNLEIIYIYIHDGKIDLNTNIYIYIDLLYWFSYPCIYAMSPKGHSKHDSHVHHQGTKRRCNATILRQLDCLLSPLLKQCVGGQTCWWNPSQLSWIQLMISTKLTNCQTVKLKFQNITKKSPHVWDAQKCLSFLDTKGRLPTLFLRWFFVHGVSTGSKSRGAENVMIHPEQIDNPEAQMEKNPGFRPSIMVVW